MEVHVEDSFDVNNPYEKIMINLNQKEEDIACDICLELEHEDDDQIVICDHCNVAVHQSCYGGDLLNQLPQDSWFCDRCKVLKQNPERRCTDIKCFLCPDIDGALKEVSKDIWAHVICVNWNPDIYFKDETKASIEGKLNKQRFDLNCNMCRKHEGACI